MTDKYVYHVAAGGPDPGFEPYEYDYATHTERYAAFYGSERKARAEAIRLIAEGGAPCRWLVRMEKRHAKHVGGGMWHVRLDAAVTWLKWSPVRIDRIAGCGFDVSDGSWYCLLPEETRWPWIDPDIWHNWIVLSDRSVIAADKCSVCGELISSHDDDVSGGFESCERCGKIVCSYCTRWMDPETGGIVRDYQPGFSSRICKKCADELAECQCITGFEPCCKKK